MTEAQMQDILLQWLKMSLEDETLASGLVLALGGIQDNTFWVLTDTPEGFTIEIEVRVKRDT